jgi:hypothetical protein
VLERSVENVPAVSDVFDIIGAIYRYLEGSPQRHGVLAEKIKKHNIVNGKTALHSLSETRWAARSDNLDTILNIFPAIISMLQEMSENGESAADGLQVRMLQLKFVASCIILNRCFSLSRCISEYLQREDMDLVSAITGIQSLKDTLSSLRNDVQFDKFLSEAKEFCRNSEIEVLEFDQQNLPKRQRTLPSYFRDGSVLLDQEGLVLQADPPRCSMEHSLKRNFYFPLLDRLHNELEKRFSSRACEILSLANVLHPQHFTAENASKAKKIANFYGIDEDQVGNQFILLSNSPNILAWREKFQQHIARNAQKNASDQKPWSCLPTLLQVFSKNDLHTLYPEVFELVQIVATLPVTVASCERTHSKIKIINNYLRASMSDDRLDSLVEITVERDLADKIELRSLVDSFKTTGNRRLPL